MTTKPTPTKDEATTFVEACQRYVQKRFRQYARLIDACDDLVIVELDPNSPKSRLVRYKATVGDDGAVSFGEPHYCHAQPTLRQANGEAERMSLETGLVGRNTPVAVQRDWLEELKKSLGSSAQPNLSLFYGELEQVLVERELQRTDVADRRKAAAIVRRRRKDLDLSDDAIEVAVQTYSTDPVHMAAARLAAESRMDLSDTDQREQVYNTLVETQPSIIPLYGEEMRLCERAGSRERFEQLKKIATERNVDLGTHFDDCKFVLYERNPSLVPSIESATSIEEALDALLYSRDGSLHFCIEEDRHAAAERVIALRPDLLRLSYGVDDEQNDETENDPVKLSEQARIADEFAAADKLMMIARDRVRELGGDPSSYTSVSEALSLVMLEHPELVHERYGPGERDAA